MPAIRTLNQTEIRVLGALLEKEQVTPDHYPLTVNALMAACNQKSNRSPVTSLTETEIVETLDELRSDVLAWRSDGARSERWSQSISRRLELAGAEKALLTLLLLRGPQTAGELRSRSHRLYAFSNLGEVETALEQLAHEDRQIAVELPRAPGQKESRWTHQLGGPVEIGERRSPPLAPAAGDRLGRLEERVQRLEEAIEELRRKS